MHTVSVKRANLSATYLGQCSSVKMSSGDRCRTNFRDRGLPEENPQSRPLSWVVPPHALQIFYRDNGRDPFFRGFIRKWNSPPATGGCNPDLIPAGTYPKIPSRVAQPRSCDGWIRAQKKISQTHPRASNQSNHSLAITAAGLESFSRSTCVQHLTLMLRFFLTFIPTAGTLLLGAASHPRPLVVGSVRSS